MRLMTLLLAFSLAFLVSINHVVEATGAATKTLGNPNQDHTFLETNKDIRPQRFLNSFKPADEEERAWNAESLKPHLQKLRSMFSRETLQKIPGKFRRGILRRKNPDELFKAIKETAVGSTKTEKAASILANMDHQQMMQTIGKFEKKDAYLADFFVKEWGIDAVATSIVNTQRGSGNSQQNMMNGNSLSTNLLDSWSAKKYKNKHVFDELFKKVKVDDTPEAGMKRLMPNDGPEMAQAAAKLELLDDFMKREGQSSKEALMGVLTEGLEGKELAKFLTLAKKENAKLPHDLDQVELDAFLSLANKEKAALPHDLN